VRLVLRIPLVGFVIGLAAGIGSSQAGTVVSSEWVIGTPRG